MFSPNALLLLGVWAGAAAGRGPVRSIGNSISQARLNATEQLLFAHSVTGDALLTHFWATGGARTATGGEASFDEPTVDEAIFRVYVDGEQRPSITFTPALAAGVGFGEQALWNSRWVGKGATTTGWWHNIAIPFRSVRVTFQNAPGKPDGVLWAIVRGSENLPLRLGSLDLTAVRPAPQLRRSVPRAPGQEPHAYLPFRLARGSNYRPRRTSCSRSSSSTSRAYPRSMPPRTRICGWSPPGLPSR